MKKFVLTIGGKIFFADLYENQISKSFTEKFPLTLMLDKENSKEYFSPLDKRLTGHAKFASTIVPGDITVCNSISIAINTGNPVLSDDSVKIGHISNIEELKKALASNKDYVTFDHISTSAFAIA